MPRTANCEVQTLKIETKSPLLVVGPTTNLKGICKQADGDIDVGDLVVRQTEDGWGKGACGCRLAHAHKCLLPAK